MRLANFSLDQLKALPLRATVAFAARCVRRVEPLAQLPEGDPQRKTRGEAVEAALRMAEAFAIGSDAPPDELVVAAIDASRDVGSESACSVATSAAAQAAHAASSARHTGSSSGTVTHVTADLAALNAYTAAAGAFVSVGYHNEDFVGAALRDYETLVRLQLGRYPEPGTPVDPSPEGPLGPL